MQLCREGVVTALRNEDYEQGAAHVHRYLNMDQHLLEKTAEDVSADQTNISSSLLTLQEAALQLRTVVTRKFDEAVKSEDLASVERFFKIFPLLGMHLEGLKKFCSYLCVKVIKSDFIKFQIHCIIIQYFLCVAPRNCARKFKSHFRC